MPPELLERQRRQRSKDGVGGFFLFVCLWTCCVLVWFDFVKIFFWRDTAGLMEGYGGTGMWAELGCMVLNSQRINKEIVRRERKMEREREKERGGRERQNHIDIMTSGLHMFSHEWYLWTNTNTSCMKKTESWQMMFDTDFWQYYEA